MVAIISILLSVLISTAIASPGSSKTHKPACLSDKEAGALMARWLTFWSTGGLTKKSELAAIASTDVYSIDETRLVKVLLEAG